MANKYLKKILITTSSLTILMGAGSYESFASGKATPTAQSQKSSMLDNFLNAGQDFVSTIFANNTPAAPGNTNTNNTSVAKVQ